MQRQKEGLQREVAFAPSLETSVRGSRQWCCNGGSGGGGGRGRSSSLAALYTGYQPNFYFFFVCLQEELQRRKKAAEKAHIMVQNALAKEKALQTTTAPLQPSTERKTQQGTTGATDSDHKAVGKKNLQHRPLKLKDKENDMQKRKLSAEKESKSPSDKAGFKESEELQRIRQILNQGKKGRKTSSSENADQETDTGEDKRKLSDSKSSKYTAVNGVKGSPTPTPAPRPKARDPNAGLHDYVESRKMNFDAFEVPPLQAQQNDEQGKTGTEKGEKVLSENYNG